jgi:hypothetical protein
MRRVLALLLVTPGPLFPYAVLAHEAMIDTAWTDTIKPLLLKRFPASTGQELLEAHAYAYGGAIIQDSGYYPFGSRFFSDLVHYVRSGDFIVNLLRESETLDEYAFALGALSHYAADDQGHSIATNRAVPMLYAKLRRRFGKIVTYEDDPAAHLKTEFGFDVAQVARGHYGPDSYHDFIGFQVSKPVLERAFRKTYALELNETFFSVDLALGTYRHTVSGIIPEMTKVAWHMKKDELKKADPAISRKKFIYNLSRASYRREWHEKYQTPGCFARFLALLLRIIPKAGPFRALAFKTPTPAVENLFMVSFDASLDRYRALLRQSGSPGFRLQNRNFDTGQPVMAGQYKLADKTFAELVGKLAGKNFSEVTPELKKSILSFYGDPNAPVATRSNPADWQKLQNELAALRGLADSSESKPAR